MLQKKYIHPAWYALCDYVSAALAWAVFYFIRIELLQEQQSNYELSYLFWLEILLIPLGWLMLFLLVGSYYSIYKKSRLNEFTKTIICCIIGSVVLFFLIVLNDVSNSYSYYYSSFLLLFVIHAVIIFLSRMFILNAAKKQLLNGVIRFYAAIVGNKESALRIQRETEKKLRNDGYHIAGFIPLNSSETNVKQLPKLGNIDELESVIDRAKIKTVILAIDKSEQQTIGQIINRLNEKDVDLKIQPNTLDILAGSVKTSNVLGAVLIDLKTNLMPEWQQNIKRLVDIVVSFSASVLLFPLMLLISLRVRLSSRGPIIYRQERIGFKGKPFWMYKFRSMHMGAEESGPALSSENDERITKWGKTMRKWRLDELPQLWNILKGEMSLVGPRPERKFYIDQIVAQFPYYKYLLKVKPGLTSWGMV
ncbi:MAG: sugar transferase, partial [Chitinophagaceae bacterium]